MYSIILKVPDKNIEIATVIETWKGAVSASIEIANIVRELSKQLGFDILLVVEEKK